MKTLVLVCAFALTAAGQNAGQNASQDAGVAREIVALERKTLDGWQTGNPDPLLAITDPGITYFHAVADTRLEGLPALRAVFENYRGMPLFESYEMAAPKVQAAGDVAVLTYILVRHTASGATRWNATQVYQRKPEGWRIIHSHWSETKQAK